MTDSLQSHPKQPRRRRAVDILLYGLILWFFGGPWIGWALGIPSQVRHRASIGEVCGPEHVWVAVRSNVTAPDLSCEPVTR